MIYIKKNIGMPNSMNLQYKVRGSTPKRKDRLFFD